MQKLLSICLVTAVPMKVPHFAERKELGFWRNSVGEKTSCRRMPSCVVVGSTGRYQLAGTSAYCKFS